MFLKFVNEMYNTARYDGFSVDLDHTRDTYRLYLWRGKKTEQTVLSGLAEDDALDLIREIHNAMNDGLRCYDVGQFCCLRSLNVRLP